MACLPFSGLAPRRAQAVTKTKATVRPPYKSQPTIPQRFSSLPPAYPELFAVVGSQVPDLRGLFLRGYGTQTHTQHNGTIVGVTPTSHASGALGVVQGDATRNISGRSGYIDYNNSILPWTPTGPFYETAVVDGAREDGVARIVQMDISRVVPTANENRPVNIAVRYLIRAH